MALGTAPHQRPPVLFTEWQHYALLSLALVVFPVAVFYKYPAAQQVVWFVLWLVVLLRMAWEASQ